MGHCGVARDVFGEVRAYCRSALEVFRHTQVGWLAVLNDVHLRRHLKTLTFRQRTRE